RRMKPVAVVMAHHANEDGENCFPSVDLIARALSLKDRRWIQRVLRELEALGVLKAPDSAKAGGHGRSTHYRFVSKKLPRANRDGKQRSTHRRKQRSTDQRST